MPLFSNMVCQIVMHMSTSLDDIFMQARITSLQNYPILFSHKLSGHMYKITHENIHGVTYVALYIYKNSTITIITVIVPLVYDIYITFQNIINERVYCSDKELTLGTIHRQSTIYSETFLVPQNNLISTRECINTNNLMQPVCRQQWTHLKRVKFIKY